MAKRDNTSILKTIFTIDLAWTLLRNKWFYIFMFVFVLVSYGNNRYKQLVDIPAADTDLAATSFSLGENGSAPGYQTQAARKLAQELQGLQDNRALKVSTGLYYNLYKKHYAAGKLATQNIKVGPNQFSQIYNMVDYACTTLGVPQNKRPRIWIGRDDPSQLTVTNYRNPSIVIGADYLWAFKPAELEFLLARQVAHIRLNNVFYLDMIKGMKAITRAALPDFISKFVIGGMGIKLMSWYKEASISADRGALLVYGDPKAAVSSLIKLNIGANVEDLYGQPDPLSFIQQIKDLPEDEVTTASAAMAEMDNANPFLTVRVQHLLDWISTPTGQKGLKYRWNPYKKEAKKANSAPAADWDNYDYQSEDSPELYQ